MPDPRLFRKTMIAFHHRSGRSFPWRESDDLYEVLVGEVLLQRTRGEHVVAVYKEFLKRWPEPGRLSRARVSTIERVIRPLGLPKRAPTLKQLGIALAALPDIPTQPTELLRLPGIGPYGAHAVPCFALDRNLPVVDWVIARVLRRYFGLLDLRRPNADHELWGLASELAQQGNARELWLGVLDFAAAVCKTRPLCGECILGHTCTFSSKPLVPGENHSDASKQAARPPVASGQS